MSTKFQDVVIVYKDLETGKEHSQRDHFKIDDRDKMLRNLVGFENPALKGKVKLVRVRFYEFFGNKVKESFGHTELSAIKGYSDKLFEMKRVWQREADISSLLD